MKYKYLIHIAQGPVETSYNHGNECGFHTILGNSRVAEQLAASQEVLSPPPHPLMELSPS
jgi:hypothetical protein